MRRGEILPAPRSALKGLIHYWLSIDKSPHTNFDGRAKFSKSMCNLLRAHLWRGISGSMFSQVLLSLYPTMGRNSFRTSIQHFCFMCTLPSLQGSTFQKMQNTSIIHNFIGQTFQRHYVSKFPEKSFVMSEAHIRRLQFYHEAPDVRVVNLLDASEHWKRNSSLPNSRWLKCWIRRELQALMQEEDVDIIMHHVLGVLEYFQRRTGKKCSNSELELRRTHCKSLLSDAVRPFVFENSGRFADELESFLISGLDISAYDELNLQSSRIGYTLVSSSGKELSIRDASIHTQEYHE